MQRFFKDLKVVELAGVLAGPATGMFFAELGAKVIKVENRKAGGDVTRTWKLASENKKQKASAYYYSVNLSKKILFADLSDKNELSKILELISSADILIVNFKKGDDRKFGLNYARLKKLNPRLVYAGITGFGDDDARVAYDLVLQAESGFMSMNGTVESGPVKMPVALIDILAAHQLKEAILVALLMREKTGKGAKVGVSLYNAAVSSLANQASNFLNAGYVAGLQGSLHPNIAPYGELFRTKDSKQITFAIGTDRQFSALCTILEAKELCSDKRFADNPSRIKNRNTLKRLLADKVKQFRSETLLRKCHDSFIPAARIRNVKEVLTNQGSKKLILSRSTEDGIRSIVKTFVASMNVHK